MGGSLRPRIAIGSAAAIWLIIAIVSGRHDGQWLALRTFSMAGAVVTLGFLVYERWGWAWPFVRYFTGKPNLNGTWRGELQSDFERDGRRIDPIPTVLLIKQTDTAIWVTLFTGESSSTTGMGQLVKESDDRWRVTFVYTNKPRPEVSSRSNQHQGVCELYVTGRGNSLGGSYFTSRKTTGELRLKEWSRHKYHDSASALTSEEFGTPRVFAKE
ncbi:hypothetical protein IRT45_05735 [Nocardia sp. BSTN01]|uniref:Cap15 family cyclic dinucleotide receptor domain-containing protein n=1 Tax=Nocardia sp. BSTN01 TaxID=2783665 RepID=UPI00188FAA74|nr:hypothetical protein [Nocardia sp. BSTN01]MBF4996655.1 hypothetical protein [Nocardia sp. BSTN01]